ncbi:MULTISPECIES: tail fiber protein [Paenibacillus]|uniref:Microcystin-dependent protein n=1 Tax=Paenibacillus polymyxa (strain SC2) TaxID=886882 RepID=E3EGN0_PAEPS|nr:MULTISPECIES: tail fiber protein [Paenibacillus]MCV9951856.1 tail fiber protein [Paenibacillus sp. BT-177]ADO54669.1 microcystin-dependent protein [Paenibacillus polymyxa SC2]AJE51107.1 microcystin-dependent protein [Paenibacillus polymyxa]AUO05881.1 microcystin-dependent protein [Paenibacillus sp. lzh-N1]AZH27923.1 microcystin-dependent protein [Paenibacillus sp. M-152]
MKNHFLKKTAVLSLLAVILLGGTAISPKQAQASPEPYIGEITMYPYTYAPKGWIKCEGQLLDISQNSVLFSLLGTNFGGDGVRTFALPDLRGASPLPNVNYYIATEGPYPSRP